MTQPRALAEAEAYAGELAGLNAARIVAVNGSAYFSRPGPRLIDGLELLGHILHRDCLPEAPGGAEALAVPGRSGEARAGGASNGDGAEHAAR